MTAPSTSLAVSTRILTALEASPPVRAVRWARKTARLFALVASLDPSPAKGIFGGPTVGGCHVTASCLLNSNSALALPISEPPSAQCAGLFDRLRPLFARLMPAYLFLLPGWSRSALNTVRRLRDLAGRFTALGPFGLCLFRLLKHSPAQRT